MLKNLPALRTVIDELAEVGRAIDQHGNDYEIPFSLKENFGRAWGKPFTVKTDLIKLKTAATEDGARTIPVVDALLLKCACAVSLYDAYAEYMSEAERVRSSLSLDREDWKKLGEDKALPNPLKGRIVTAVDKLDGLNETAKIQLKRFLTDEKQERVAEFGNYKGLSRPDPFQPVAATALGLRVDFSGYIDEIIHVLEKHRDVRDALVAIAKNPGQKSSVAPNTRSGQDLTAAFREVCAFCARYNQSPEPWMRDDPKVRVAHDSLDTIQGWLLRKVRELQRRSICRKPLGRGGSFPTCPLGLFMLERQPRKRWCICLDLFRSRWKRSRRWVCRIGV